MRSIFNKFATSKPTILSLFYITSANKMNRSPAENRVDSSKVSLIFLHLTTLRWAAMKSLFYFSDSCFPWHKSNNRSSGLNSNAYFNPLSAFHFFTLLLHGQPNCPFSRWNAFCCQGEIWHYMFGMQVAFRILQNLNIFSSLIQFSCSLQSFDRSSSRLQA